MQYFKATASNWTVDIVELFLPHFFRNEDEKNKLGKKKDGNLDISLENFGVINFAEVIDKNIDIKKDNVTQESVKSKTRCFTQLEKGIGQQIPINIYDVNGEIIGKKYDFR